MSKVKLDLTKEYKSYYTAKTTPEIIEVEEAQFLTIQGKGVLLKGMNLWLNWRLYILLLMELKC